PLTGFTAMLKSVVPTPVKNPVSASDVALIANTSLSGRLKRTAALQSRPSSSFQPVPSNLTIRPVSGAGSPIESVRGGGRPPGMTKPWGSVQLGAVSKPLQTAPSLTVVVWLPD